LISEQGVIPHRKPSSRTESRHPAPKAVIPHRKPSSHTESRHPAPKAVIPHLMRDLCISDTKQTNRGQGRSNNQCRLV
jgi:hypothetical protein